MNDGVWKSKYDPGELAKFFVPMVQTGGELRPPGFFDQPALKARPDYITEALADRCVDMSMGKACAGLRRKWRASGSEIRQAFKECEFEGRVLAALEWAVPGMREEQMVRFMTISGLSVRELAEGFRVLFGSGAFDYANHINALADDLLSAAEAQTEAPWLQRGHVTIPLGYDALVGGMASERLFEVREGDPRWTYRPEYGWIVISLGKMHYILDPDDLCRAHESRRSVVRSGCAFHDGTEKMAELRQANFQASR